MYKKILVAIDPASIYEALVAEGGHITQHARDRLKNEGLRGQTGVLDNFLSGHATVDQIQHMAEEFQADLRKFHVK